MASSDKQWLFLKDLSKLIIYADETLGYKLTGGELWRPIEMQQIYLKIGKTTTLNSKHLERMAIDLNCFVKVNNVWTLTWKKEDFEPLGIYWESLDKPNNVWGGRFNKLKDYCHFEKR